MADNQNNNMWVVEASGLRKVYRGRHQYQKHPALDGVDINVKKSEIFGVLGPNGSGKTTLLNCLALLLEPDDGNIFLFGESTRGNSKKLRSYLNMCSGNPNFPWCLTVKENLSYYGMLYGLYGSELRMRVDNLVTLLELGKFAFTRYDELSTGTKQKLALAKALINRPKLLFLDEPTVGLDPDVSGRIRSLIVRIHENEGVTIILTTHYMAEAEQLCDRIAFLCEGKILALGTANELKRQVSAKNLEEVFLELSKH